jgi:WD40 repeat protein
MAAPRFRSDPPPGSQSERLNPSRPWPGLASFVEADRQFFRGRNLEADELARLVRREPLTVVFGRSGLGKTSLLGAGLFPRLREDLHLPVLIRLAHGAEVPLREQIWQAVAAACQEAAADATAPQNEASLWEHFHCTGAGFWNARNRALTPVLVFDQFEELFTLAQANDQSRRRAVDFVVELSDLIEDRPPEALRRALDADPEVAERIDFRRRGCKVVLSFREDFLAEMEGLRVRIPSLMRNRYRLLPMDGNQAREVIASGGDLVAGDVAERIIGLAWRNRAQAPQADDYERMEVDPALLSVICSELNLRRIAQDSDRIGAELLAGAEREILVDFYERSLLGLDPRVRVFVEDELITEAGYRDSHAFDDALALPGVTRAAVEHLVAGRLLRVDDRFGVRRLELTHDVLTRVVKDSRDAREARDAEAATAARERNALQVQQRNRRRAVWIAIASVLALVMLVGAGASMLRAKAANEQALATNLIANARAVQSDRPDRALLLGAEASHGYPERLDAQLAQLARLIANEGVHKLLRIEGNVTTSATSPDGLRTAIGTDRGYIIELDLKTWNVLRRWKAHNRYVLAMAYDADASRLVSADADDMFAWQLRYSTTVRPRALPPPSIGRVSTLRPLRFIERIVVSPGGQFVAMVDGRGYVDVSAMPGHSGAAAARNVGRSDGSCLGFDAQDATLYYGTAYGIVAAKLAGESEAPLPRAATQSVLARARDCRFDAALGNSPEGGPIVELRDARTGTVVGSLGYAGDGNVSVVFESGGRYVALHGAETTAVWTTEPLRRKGDVKHDTGRVSESSISPDGRWLAMNLDDGWVAVYPIGPAGRWAWLPRTARRGPARLKIKQAQPTTAFLFSADGDSVLADKLEEPERVHPIWSLAPTHALVSDEPSSSRANQVEFNRTGRVLATATPATSKAHFWSAANGQHLYTAPDNHVALFSGDGSRLAILRSNGSIDVLDADNMDGSPILHLPKPKKTDFEGFAISGDNRHLAVTRSDGSIHVHEINRDGHETTVLPGKQGSDVVVFGPDGPDGPDSPDGRTLAVAGGDDGAVRLYRFGPSAAMTTRPDTLPDALPDPHNGHVLQLALSPDGRSLASGGDDGMVILRDIASGRTVAAFGPHKDVAGFGPHKDVAAFGPHKERLWKVDRLVFIGGGDALVSGEGTGAREVWDVRKGSRLARLRDAGGTVSGVDISPEGHRVAVLHVDQTVSLRSWDHETMLKDACEIVGRNLDCAEWRQFMAGSHYHKTCPDLPEPACD